jgi:hypothetical protein
MRLGRRLGLELQFFAPFKAISAPEKLATIADSIELYTVCSAITVSSAQRHSSGTSDRLNCEIGVEKRPLLQIPEAIRRAQAPTFDAKRNHIVCFIGFPAGPHLYNPELKGFAGSLSSIRPEKKLLQNPRKTI